MLPVREILARTQRVDWRLVFVSLVLLGIAWAPVELDSKATALGCVIAMDRLFLAKWAQVIGRDLPRHDPTRPGYKPPMNGGSDQETKP